jgi:uncharacterized protein (DUF4415 family)
LKPNRKVSITFRFDREWVERFKATGAGRLTRINEAMRKTTAS